MNLFQIKNLNVPEYHNKSIFNIANKSLIQTDGVGNGGDDSSINSLSSKLGSFEAHQSSFQTEPA